MKQQKSLAYDSTKKKKILLGTLIPLGGLVLATAIVVPVVLTQCKSDGFLKLKVSESEFTIYQVEQGVEIDILNWNSSWYNVVGLDAQFKTFGDYDTVRSTANLELQNSRGSTRTGIAPGRYGSILTSGRKTIYGFAQTKLQDEESRTHYEEKSYKIPGTKFKLEFNIIEN